MVEKEDRDTKQRIDLPSLHPHIPKHTQSGTKICCWSYHPAGHRTSNQRNKPGQGTRAGTLVHRCSTNGYCCDVNLLIITYLMLRNKAGQDTNVCTHTQGQCKRWEKKDGDDAFPVHKSLISYLLWMSSKYCTPQRINTSQGHKLLANVKAINYNVCICYVINYTLLS